MASRDNRADRVTRQDAIVTPPERDEARREPAGLDWHVPAVKGAYCSANQFVEPSNGANSLPNSTPRAQVRDQV